MSTVQLGLCWPLILDPSAKAVLVSLADQANDDGDCYPAVGTIALRTCLSERTVQEALKRLQARGLLEVATQASRRRTNLYRLTLEDSDCPRAESLASRRARERKERTELVPTPQQLHPAAAAPRSSCTLDPAAAAPEPSVEPNTNTPIPPAKQGAEGLHAISAEPLKPKRRTAARPGLLGLADWLTLCREEGVLPIPADDPVFDYAETVGISREMVAMAWHELKRKRLRGGKGQKDWRATFRDAVRGNWFRLWLIRGPGEMAVLTTTGEQLRRELLALVGEAA
jgi:hypothetical protein